MEGPDKYYRLRELRRALPSVVVKVDDFPESVEGNILNILQGINTVQRAIINIKEKDDHRGKKGDKEMLVEGYGLQKVMTTDGTCIASYT